MPRAGSQGQQPPGHPMLSQASCGDVKAEKGGGNVLFKKKNKYRESTELESLGNSAFSIVISMTPSSLSY